MTPVRLSCVDVQRHLMAAILACGFAVANTLPARAAEPGSASLTVDWKARADKGLVQSGEVVQLTEQRPFDAAHALKVVSQATQTAPPAHDPVIPLATIDNPPITRQTFSLNGWIRHQGVAGKGYLEMWTVFEDGSHYFSRTLASAGPLQVLSGDSGWREISLPFQLSDDPQAPRPNKLIINAVLPGAGEITLSDLTLTEGDNLAAAMKPAGAWWNDHTAAWIGGIGGTVLGLIGAAIGTLTGMGRGRPIVIALLVAMTALGSLTLLGGLVAVFAGQPYGVYYPLLLGGGLSAILSTVFLFTTPQRYAAIEMRRMQALDA